MFRTLRRLLPCLVLLRLAVAAAANEPHQLEAPQPSFSQEHYEAAVKSYDAQDWNGAITAAARHIELAEREEKTAREIAIAARRTTGRAVATGSDSPKAKEYDRIARDNFMSLRQGYRVRALALVRRNDEGDAAQAIEDFAHVLPGPEADLPDASTEAAPFAIVTPVETLVECYAARGWARYTLQDFPGGTTDYTEALHLRPDDVALLYGHAVGLANTGQLEAAYPEARRAAELDPAYLEAFYLAGQLALRLGRDYRGALEMFDRALVLEPQAGRVYGERARVQMCLGSFSQAAADLDRAITLLEEQHEPTAYLRFQRHLLCIRLRLATPDLSDFVASLADGWTKVLGTFLTGAIGEQELLAAATRGEQRDLSRQQGEAHYYAGMLRLLHGDQVAARDHLSRTVAAGQTRSVEFEQARAEIVRLDRNR